MNTLRLFRYGLFVGVRDFTGNWNWKTWFGGWITQVVAMTFFFSFIARLFDSPEHERFLLIGNAVFSGIMLVSWTVLSTNWDRRSGTYPLLVIAPSSMVPAIMGRTSIWFLGGAATALSVLFILGTLFDLVLPWPETLFIVPLVLLTCASAYCQALLLGCLIMGVPRSGGLVLSLWNAGVRAFCGVFVPITFWPDALQTIIQLVPITHGLQAIRLLLDESSATAILRESALEVGVGLVWMVIAIFTMDRMANAGRKSGSIEFID